MINAYDDMYLEKARVVLANMLDYAVYDLHYNIEEIWEMFLHSNFSKRFSEGDASILVGKSGVELAYDVIYHSMGEYPEVQPTFVMERRPEYWMGSVLAYYQWYTSLSFEEITRNVSIQDIQDLYTRYHEMDILQFVDEMNRLFLKHKKETNLKMRRMRLGLSQRELSELADVSFRTIQQYEQRQKDINRASGETLMKLAHVLGCNMEDMIEKI